MPRFLQQRIKVCEEIELFRTAPILGKTTTVPVPSLRTFSILAPKPSTTHMPLTFLKDSYIVEIVDVERSLVAAVDSFVSLLSPAFRRQTMVRPLSRPSDKANLHLTSVDGLVTEKAIICNIKLLSLPAVISLVFSYTIDPVSHMMRLLRSAEPCFSVRSTWPTVNIP